MKIFDIAYNNMYRTSIMYIITIIIIIYIIHLSIYIIYIYIL